MTDKYDPIGLPWLSIVNHLSPTTMNAEVTLVMERIIHQLREIGGASVSAALNEAVRLDRARTTMLIVLVQATWPHKDEIPGWVEFRNKVLIELKKRGHDIMSQK